jgi:hypothetical protein
MKSIILAFILLALNYPCHAAQKGRHASMTQKVDGLPLVDDTCYAVFDYLDADSLNALAMSCKQMNQLVPSYIHFELSNQEVQSKIAKIYRIAADLESTEPGDLKKIENEIKKINRLTYKIDDILKTSPKKRELANKVVGHRLNPIFRSIFEAAKDWSSKDFHVYHPRIWVIETMTESPVLDYKLLDDIFERSRKRSTIFKASLLPKVAMNQNTSNKTIEKIIQIAKHLETRTHSNNTDLNRAYDKMTTALIEGLARHRNLDPKSIERIKTSFPEYYSSPQSKVQKLLDNPSILNSYSQEKLVRQVHYYKTLAKTFSNLLE